MLCYSYTEYRHWNKLGKRYMGPPGTILQLPVNLYLERKIKVTKGNVLKLKRLLRVFDVRVWNSFK